MASDNRPQAKNQEDSGNGEVLFWIVVLFIAAVIAIWCFGSPFTWFAPKHEASISISIQDDREALAGEVSDLKSRVKELTCKVNGGKVQEQKRDEDVDYSVGYFDGVETYYSCNSGWCSTLPDVCVVKGKEYDWDGDNWIFETPTEVLGK